MALHPDRIALPVDAAEGTDLGLSLLKLLARGGRVEIEVVDDSFAAQRWLGDQLVDSGNGLSVTAALRAAVG